MRLKWSYANIEEIPEGSVKDFFVEGENGYTLDGEGFVTSETHGTLEKSLQKQKTLTRQIEKQRDEAIARIPEGYDEDRWTSFLTWQETHKDGDPDPKITLEVREEKIRELRIAAEEKVRKETQSGMKEKDDRIAFLLSALQSEMKKNALEKALHNNRIKPDDFELVRDHHEKRIGIIEEDDLESGTKKFRAIVEVDGIERDVDKYIEEWSSEKGKRYVEPLRTIGGGQNGDGTRLRRTTANPFRKTTWNLTAQGELRRDNPKLYEEMRREAETSP